jgi:hypothetical protein
LFVPLIVIEDIVNIVDIADKLDMVDIAAGQKN